MGGGAYDKTYSWLLMMYFASLVQVTPTYTQHSKHFCTPDMYVLLVKHGFVWA